MSSSTVDTTSTDNWVSARSGADRLTKVSDVTSPTTPTSTTDWNRWWCVATSVNVVPASSSQMAIASGEAGNSSRGPVPMGLPLPSTVTATTAMAAPSVQAR